MLGILTTYNQIINHADLIWCIKFKLQSSAIPSKIPSRLASFLIRNILFSRDLWNDSLKFKRYCMLKNLMSKQHMNFLTLFFHLRRKNLKCIFSSSLEQWISNWRLNSSIFSAFTQSGIGSSWRLWGTIPFNWSLILCARDLRAASFKD